MNLAPRPDLIQKTATSEKVGPNTYNIGECCNYNKKNLVPFLSDSVRLKPLKKGTGPDFYETCDYLHPRIKYGNSLRYTAERKTIVVNKDDSDESKIKPRNLKPPSKRTTLKANKGKVAFCRVSFGHGYSAPSIPNKNSTGYDLDENDTLFRNPPEDFDTTVGPATYNVPQGELCFNTIRYAGCAWSKSKSKRNMGITNDNPGPGDYSPRDPKCVRYRGDFQQRPLMRKCCNVPRFTCQLSCKSTFEKSPAPGSYEIVDLNKIGKVKNLSMKPIPFINGAERFQYKAMQGPGPQTYQTDLSAATYNVDPAFKHIIGNKVYQKKANFNGFNSTEIRADPLPDFAGKFFLYGKDTPGVGSYTLNLKCSCESTGHCFKTSPRGDPAVKTRTPGPDYYQLHPSKIESLWEAKRTYNYRLLNNVIRRNPQMKGPKLGMRSSVKASRKKILRFFVKTGDFKHCW